MNYSRTMITFFPCDLGKSNESSHERNHELMIGLEVRLWTGKVQVRRQLQLYRVTFVSFPSKCVHQECTVCCWCSLVSDIMSSAKRLVHSMGGSQLERDKTDDGEGRVGGSHSFPVTRLKQTCTYAGSHPLKGKQKQHASINKSGNIINTNTVHMFNTAHRHFIHSNSQQ